MRDTSVILSVSLWLWISLMGDVRWGDIRWGRGRGGDLWREKKCVGVAECVGKVWVVWIACVGSVIWLKVLV